MNFDKPIVVLDLETTDADPTKAEAVQFAAVRLEPDKRNPITLEFLCKPSIPVEDGAVEVHGISNERLENEPPFAVYAQEVVDICEGAIIAGYNSVRFDIPILDRQLAQAGFEGVFDNSILYDAFEMFKRHNGRKLEDASRYYLSKEIENAHDALGDVLTTLDVMKKQVEMEGIDVTEASLLTAPHPSMRVGTTSHIRFNDEGNSYINFGKHKGTELRNMDRGYLTWMLNNDFPHAVKNHIRAIFDEQRV